MRKPSNIPKMFIIRTQHFPQESRGNCEMSSHQMLLTKSNSLLNSNTEKRIDLTLRWENKDKQQRRGKFNPKSPLFFLQFKINIHPQYKRKSLKPMPFLLLKFFQLERVPRNNRTLVSYLNGPHICRVYCRSVKQVGNKIGIYYPD